MSTSADGFLAVALLAALLLPRTKPKPKPTEEDQDGEEREGEGIGSEPALARV